MIMRSNRLTTAVSALKRVLRENRTPLLIFTITRCGLFLLTYLSLATVQDPCVFNPVTPPVHPFPNNLFLDGWARWDSAWYQHIAEHGYMDVVVGPAGQKNIAFFPLYPTLIRCFNIVLHNSLLSGILISNLAFLGAVVLLYQIIKARFGAQKAGQTILLLSVSPFSFYFSAMYSESVFFLLVVAAFYFAQRKQWWAAAVSAMLSGTARMPGLAMFPALVIYYLERINFDLRKVHLDILWLPLSALGPAIYALYLYVQFGDALFYFRALQVPGWGAGGLKLELAAHTITEFSSVRNLLAGNYNVMFVLNLLMGGIFCLTLIPIFRRQGIAYGVFSLLIIGAGSVQWLGLGRYVLTAFPVYLAWSLMLRNRLLFESVLAVSSLLLALLTIMYSHSYWVA